jgi:hypothetical protein
LRSVRAKPFALVLLLAGCTSVWNERYLERVGVLSGQKALLDRYVEAIRSARLEDVLVLFDEDATAQRAGAAAIVDLRGRLAPLFETGGSVDMVEGEVRDFDLFGAPPSARLWFSVGGRDGEGVRHHYRVSSFSTFREVSRLPADAEGLRVANMALLEQDPFVVEHRAALTARYQEITKAAGLSHRHMNQSIDRKCLILQGTMPGSGASAADFDLDGRVDLVAIDGQSSLLYLNRGDGTFADRSREWGLDAISGAGCVTADYDNDGDDDLCVLDHFGGTKLLRNDVVDGARRFVDVTAEAGVACPDPTFSASFGDVDRDGDLDLYMPVAGDYYSEVPMPPFDARDGRPDRLYINDGTGHFTEEGEARGVADVGWGLASGFCDYDGDGDDDLYMANDFGVNCLFRNDGTGRFEDVAADVGASDRGYGMGVSWGDVDGDGDFDLYVSDIYSEYAPLFLDPDYPFPFLGRIFRSRVGPWLARMGTGNALLLNQGDGTFVDVGKEWRVNECGWAWAGMFLDFDADGDLDIYCPDGSYAGTSSEDLELTFWALSSLMWQRSKMQQWLFDSQGRSLQGRERKRLFEQLAPGKFAEVGFLDGVDAIETGRGLVIADFDDDGYPDLYLRNLDSEAVYYRNAGGSNHWLKLVLVGTKSNRGAVGAVVRATADGRTQMRQVTAGEGFYSSHDKRPLFGLGGASAADVEVRWPSGLVESFPNLAADRAYTVVEGSGTAVPVERPAAPAPPSPPRN